jgi:hypothetical protein
VYRIVHAFMLIVPETLREDTPTQAKARSSHVALRLAAFRFNTRMPSSIGRVHVDVQNARWTASLLA